MVDKNVYEIEDAVASLGDQRVEVLGGSVYVERKETGPEIVAQKAKKNKDKRKGHRKERKRNTSSEVPRWVVYRASFLPHLCVLLEELTLIWWQLWMAQV